MSRAALAVVALLLVPATASAAPPLERSPDLWATVNVCDTAANPDRIGIRGSMPGLGRRATLFMRFRVHYLAAADGKWHNLGPNGSTRFNRIGTTSNRVLEGGFSFKIPPPADGGTHTLRGAVTFLWKRKGRTVKKVREITERGHRSAKGADPPGFSAAICNIS